jgi:hypothetical protein
MLSVTIMTPEETNNLSLQQPEVVAQITALLEKYKADGRRR